MAGVDIISDTTGKAIVESIKALGLRINADKRVYGFHIDGNDSNPSTRVRYLLDAVGMTPAKMNFTAGTFDYGSWADAFFMPRPCMLKYDGTVDYYLNENDYTKKADGTASDIANADYGGNAMMEWGDGTNLIWWKIVPDKGNNKSASIYIANYKADDDFVCYNHIDKDGNVKAHFYTAIYNGSLDSSNRLRSISGQTVMKSKTATQEMSYANANGSGWDIETYVDRMLISFLLILISKSTNSQACFGDGMSQNEWQETLLLQTGTMNTKGLFWGESTGKSGVKVFGMENFWGNQWRRTAGLILANGITKARLTPPYNTDGSGYKTISSVAPSGTSGGYIKDIIFTKDGFAPSAASGSESTYYCDGLWYNNEITAFALFGGYLVDGRLCGSLYVNLATAPSDATWTFGASSSYK